MLPGEMKFTKNHEWIEIDDDKITLGITDYAQGELGDIIFVELPKIGDVFNQGDTIGTIEAVKTVADIYSPMKGKVVEINNSLEQTPDSINNDPYGSGWIIKLDSIIINLSELLSADSYNKYIE